MGILIILLTIILGLLIIGNIYVQGRTVPESIDPRSEEDMYYTTRSFHYTPYYMYGRVVGWFVPRDSGYYRTIHSGSGADKENLTMSYSNYIYSIQLCGRAFDSNGNVIASACVREYASIQDEYLYETITIDYGAVRAVKAQTYVYAVFHHYHDSTFAVSFSDSIPYSYVEVNY